MQVRGNEKKRGKPKRKEDDDADEGVDEDRFQTKQKMYNTVITGHQINVLIKHTKLHDVKDNAVLFFFSSLVNRH